MRAVWKPLIVDRAWNAELREAGSRASGAYVVRRKSDREVLYVGMSETGQLWKTMTRHFHDWKSLPKHFWSADGTRLVRGKETFQHARPELLEAAIFVTSTGKRTKHTPDRFARTLETDLISRYQPKVNVDPGHAWDDRDAERELRRRGKHRPSPASSEAVPEAEIEDAAREPDEVYEDTSPDPDDPFAVRNPAPRRRGRYADRDMSKPCECGHTLGQHDAGSDRDPVRACQECAACEDFRAAKKRNPPKKAPALDINVPTERRADMRTPDLFNPARRNPAHVAPLAPRTATVEKPDGFLVELGRLTALEVKSRIGGTVSSAKWSVRAAPILAYDLRGRLFIVYVDGGARQAARSERSRYRATHWGQEGRGELRDGAIVSGSCAVWGVGTRITYTTKKGEDRELVDYVHDWGEGATSAWEPPLVVRHGAKFALAGGTYRVDTRGIVG